MFVLAAMTALIAEWSVPLLMPILIFALRARGMRAVLAGIAWVLVILLKADTVVYLLTGVVHYPEDPGGRLMESLRILSWYRIEIALLALVATAALCWPWPRTFGLRLLATVTLAILALSLVMMVLFSGLDMR